MHHTAWSRKFGETGSQFPKGLVQIRQIWEFKRSVNPSQAELGPVETPRTSRHVAPPAPVTLRVNF